MAPKFASTYNLNTISTSYDATGAAYSTEQTGTLTVSPYGDGNDSYLMTQYDNKGGLIGSFLAQTSSSVSEYEGIGFTLSSFDVLGGAGVAGGNVTADNVTGGAKVLETQSIGGGNGIVKVFNIVNTFKPGTDPSLTTYRSIAWGS